MWRFAYVKSMFKSILFLKEKKSQKGMAHWWWWGEVKWRSLSRVWLCDPIDCIVHRILQAWILEWVAFSSPEDLPNPGIKPRSQHCRRILYQLSHRGSPRILEWVAFPSPGDLPDPGMEMGSPASQADSLPTKLWGMVFAPKVSTL